MMGVLEGEQPADRLEERIIEIETERLRDFRDHPFRIKEDQEMKDLMDSIRSYGMLRISCLNLLPEVAKPGLLHQKTNQIIPRGRQKKSHPALVLVMTEYGLSTWLRARLIPEVPKTALLTDPDSIPEVMVLAPKRFQKRHL